MLLNIEILRFAVRRNLAWAWLSLHLLCTTACLAGAEDRLPVGDAAIAAYAEIVDRRVPLKVPRKVLTPYYAWYVGDGKWGSVPA